MPDSAIPSESSVQYTAPGKVLRAAREAAGLSQSDVATKLNLSKQYIKDIEADDYSHFSAEIYVSGYLRSYAMLCNIDSKPLIEAFRNMGFADQVKRSDRISSSYLNSSVQKVVKRHNERRRWAAWASGLVLLIIFGLILTWWHGQRNQPHGVAVLPAAMSSDANTKATTVSIPLSIERVGPHHHIHSKRYR